MATIKDVARMADVSVSTVSKYINGGSVRQENALSIRQAIEELEAIVETLAPKFREANMKALRLGAEAAKAQIG